MLDHLDLHGIPLKMLVIKNGSFSFSGKLSNSEIDFFTTKIYLATVFKELAEDLEIVIWYRFRRTEDGFIFIVSRNDAVTLGIPQKVCGESPTEIYATVFSAVTRLRKSLEPPECLFEFLCHLFQRESSCS